MKDAGILLLFLVSLAHLSMLESSEGQASIFFTPKPNRHRKPANSRRLFLTNVRGLACFLVVTRCGSKHAAAFFGNAAKRF